jgi:hypothetical protein
MLIKDKKIDRISGPVSFALLKPKKFIFDELKKEGVHLPIFMLFGDVHFSDKYQCNNCTCNGGSSAVGCCMPIYSNEFLRLIDSISTNEYPVDFGIEGFYAGVEKQNLRYEDNLKLFKTKNNDIMEKLREQNIICYEREKRGTKLYEKYCPTKNIRWQYTDPRHARGTKYNLEHLIQSLEDPIYNKLSSLFIGKVPSKNEIQKVITGLKNNYNDMFYKVIVLKYYMVTSPEKAIDYFFTIATTGNSLVIKQFNKLSKSFKDLPFWKKSLSDYFLHALKEGEKNDYGKNPSKDYIDLVKNIRKEFYELIIKDDIDTLSIRLTDTLFRNALHASAKGANITENTVFMDLYYVFRTFKIPRGDRNPYLSIIFGGDFHRRNITFFLANIIKYYDIVEEVKIKGDFIYNEDAQMRCTYMPNINLNDLALQYGINVNAIRPYIAPYVAPYVAPPVRRGSGGAKAGGGRRRTPVRRGSRGAKAGGGGRRRTPVKRGSKGGRRRTPVKRASGGRRRTPVKRASGGRRRTPVKRASGGRRTPVKRASASRRRSPVRKSAGRRRR